MICPKCKKFFFEKYGALSRKDNETLICSECGTAEALEDFEKFIKQNENHIPKID